MSMSSHRLGRYEILGTLARGGMGEVYLARTTDAAPGFDKKVAIKMLAPQLANSPTAVAMFHDEARVMARLDHGNICSVLDFGESGGRHFLVMEYLEGATFGAVCRASHGAADPQRMYRMARVIADAAAGLHAAHELRDPQGALLGVVHRDVTPGNVFVTRGGSVKIMDFGIVRASDQVHRTATGAIRGTYGYMSPEQLSAKVVDRRADVWSLGCLLWEGLVGGPAFGRTDEVETVAAVRQGTVETPSSSGAASEAELDAIVMRSLQPSPADRFPTARALSMALVHWLVRSGVAMSTHHLADWVEELPIDARELRDRPASSKTVRS